MIRKFFQNLNSSDVRYMLISGQATVLYGAATFSEDIDIWVMPESDNWKKFIDVIQNLNAKVYKLTPPLKMEFVLRGHGFHFQFPKTKEEPVWFLDVMGLVPRLKNFEKAWEKSKIFETDWGKIPVVGLKDLVEIKKTRRLEDYPIISKLVRIEYERLSQAEMKADDWRWILSNSFEAEDIFFFIEKDEQAQKICMASSRECLKFFQKGIEKKKEKYLPFVSKEIAFEIERLRDRDRKYWGEIINELKELKREGKLLKIRNRPE